VLGLGFRPGRFREVGRWAAREGFDKEASEFIMRGFVAGRSLPSATRQR